MNAKSSRHAIERPALLMLGACLLVIAIIIGLLVVDQRNDREEQIRARGVSLVRLLAGLPNVTLRDDRTYESMLHLVSFSQGSEDFAYAALVDSRGNPLASVASPGVIVPPAAMPRDPSGWIGERRLPGGPDRAAVIEYYAPVFDAGDLYGHIRLGFHEPGYVLLYEEVPVAASLALLIFLLAPLFYYLLRREVRPLARASAEIESLLRDNEPREVLIGATPSLSTFIERFNRFVEQAQSRIVELENEQGELVASTKLISYEKTRIDAILNTLPDAVLVLDDHGKINYANERVSTLLGAARSDVLSKPPREWCPSAAAEFLARYETSTATRYATDTLRFQLEDSRNAKTLALNGYPLFSVKGGGQIQGTLIIVRDVTEEMLAQTNRAEFVAHLGHELKTPLNTLTLYTEVLLEMDPDDRGRYIEAVNTISDEVERLVSLINNLLSITRIEMGGLDLDKQRVRLSELLEDIRANLDRTAKQQEIRIDLRMPRELSPVTVDKELLRIAINNLLSNAIKYNRPKGTVKVEVEEDDEAVWIRVADTGLGISPADQAHIFDKFYRSEDDEVRLRGGHGLGLSLAREIVELHDGEIRVASELGRGSTFTIALWKQFGLVQKAI